MIKQRRAKWIWFGRLHADLPWGAHPVTWQGWLLIALMVVAEVMVVFIPALSDTQRWIVRGAIFAVFLIIVWATRDPRRIV